LESKHLFPREPGVHSPGQLGREDGERLGFAVLVFELRKIRLAQRVVASEEHGRCGKSPAQMDVADFLARGPEPFAPGLLSAFDQAAIRDEILHARKTAEVLPLVEQDQRQNLPAARHRLQAGKGRHLVRLGRARNIEFPRAQQLVVGSNEGDIDCDRLAHAGIGGMIFDALTIGFVGEFLADLREIVLASGILHVGQKFRPLALPLTKMLVATNIAARRLTKGLIGARRR
jgi:hypothetical protein